MHGILDRRCAPPSQPTDEREAKRLRRKQSNRESARRSRQKKQQECDGLSQSVKNLTVRAPTALWLSRALLATPGDLGLHVHARSWHPAACCTGRMQPART